MSAAKSSITEYFRPEVRAGGYTRDDGSIEFYLRIQSILTPSSVVLDLGAGRGERAERLGCDFPSEVFRIKGKVSRFLGADVDPIVTSNPLIDEAVVLDSAESLPFASAFFDVVICDWVLEHIEDPSQFAENVKRVLKPGGWLCARTPSRYSYFAVAARFVPSRMEAIVLNRVQPDRKDIDIFPKHYRLNTAKSIAAVFPPKEWFVACYLHNPPPAYHGDSKLLFRILSAYQTLFPSTRVVFAQKRA